MFVFVYTYIEIDGELCPCFLFDGVSERLLLAVMCIWISVMDVRMIESFCKTLYFHFENTNGV